jgi:hypothetical protein
VIITAYRTEKISDDHPYIGGYLRTGRGRTPVTGRGRFSGLLHADLADSVRSGTGPPPFGVVWPRAGKGPGALIELTRHWQAGG